MSQALTNIRLKTHDKLAGPMLRTVIALGFDVAFRIAEGPEGYGCSGRFSKRTILHYPPRTTSSTLDDRQPVTLGNVGHAT